jgi:hypothetical protein
VLIAALISFGYGYLYFSERFAGKDFMQIHQTKPDAPMLRPLVLEAINLLLLSWLIAVFYMLQFDYGMVRGIGLLFGLTILLSYFVVAGFSQKPTKLAVVNSGYFIGVVVINLLAQYVSRMI